MPRPLLIRSNSFSYHVSIRSNNREWFYIPIADVWSILAANLVRAGEKYAAQFHALVLMSNHFHMLLTTPQGNVDDVMRYFLSLATRDIQFRAKRINHVFGARYKWSILENAYALAYVYKYVMRNPVRGNICEFVQDYQWSTLNNLNPGVPISEGVSDYWKFIPRTRTERLIWLNMPTDKEKEELIGRALRRHRFQFTKDNSHQAKLRLLKQSYGIETF